ncbi:hypothetical protein M9434_001287 [Picochlorum sp. BPE23]|nr:hypothetical protein M9434_001287 [Picochlorum sp. BPE23]KAI8112034.1 hypothetical protein M9435_004529 [Picochlorum sp. BPE23]
MVLIDGKIYKSIRQDPELRIIPVVDCFASLDDRFCLPSWIIVSGAKSGSSALWQYLCDNVGSKCADKEIHYHDQPLIPFIKTHMGQNESFGSGNMGMLPPLQDFIVKHSNTKFIALIRNPIEWAYAAWHFWCNPLFDGHDCTDWASNAENKTERTPENFERLLESYCVRNDKCFLHGWSNWDRALNFAESLPASRLIIIRSESLADDVSGTLEKLWDFLGLENKLRHPDIVVKAFNTGRSNGIANSENVHLALGKSYPPMTARSRAIICHVLDYWNSLSYFVNKYQIQLHKLDLYACPGDS